MLLKRLTIAFIFLVFFNLLAFNALATFNFLGTVRYNNGTVVSGALVNITTAPFFFPGAPANVLIQQNFSGITNATGNFVVNVTNSSQESFFGNYRLRVYLNKSDGNVTHMSALYPELPQFALQNELSGGNIYIGPAATIILDAYNGTGISGLTVNKSGDARGNVSFAGMIMDNSLGMPVDFFAEFSAGANGGGNVTSHRFVVPVGRNYSIVMYKPFNLSAVGGAGSEPATPPASVTIQILNATNAYNLDVPAENFTNTTYGLVINYTRNLTFVKKYIQGFVNVTGNTTAVNFTRILAYPMLSNYVRVDMPVFMLPSEQQMVSATGRYNVSLIGGATAVSYLLVAFGVHQNGTAADFGGFVNISVGNNDFNGFNFTLEKLAGSYSNANNNLNISQIILNVSGSSLGGDSNVQGAFVVVEANYTTNAGQTFIKYIASPNTSGMAALPLIERYDGNITAKVFSHMFAPKKIKLNITNSTYVPIKLKSFNMEKVGKGNNNGSSGANFTGVMNLKVFVNNATCNVFMPPPSCSLMGAGEGARAEQFSPMKFMLGGGKINMRIDQDATGISIMFVGVDILGSGPPDATFNDQADSNSTSNDLNQQQWKFGSGAPEIYDWVIYGIHYEDSAIDDSFKMNTTMATLYDNDWNAIWNGSSNTLGQNIPGEFAGFNNSWFNQSNPMHCDSNISKVVTINTTYQGCYVNTTNNTIWMSIPHFSGQLAQTTSSGTKAASSGSSTPSSSSGTSSVVNGGTAKTTTTPEAAVETNSIANEIKQSAERISTILEDLKIKAAVQDVVGSLPLNEVAKNSEAVSKSVSVSRSIESKTATVLTTNIKYAGKDLVKEFMVYDIIPKTFASDISEVTVSTPAKAKYKVIEKDPKILIIFENITEGENNVVTYLIDKHLSANVINDFDSPILFAKEITTKEELVKKEVAKPISKEETKEAVKKPIRSYSWALYLIILLVIAAVVYFVVKKQR